MKRFVLILLVFVLSIFIYSCTDSGSVARTKWNIGSPKSFTEELTFNELGRSFAAISLEIDIRITEGTITWEAYDPHGNLILSDSTQGKHKQTTRVDPLPGEWRLEISAEDVLGKMEFLWRGRK